MNKFVVEVAENGYILTKLEPDIFHVPQVFSSRGKLMKLIQSLIPHQEPKAPKPPVVEEV